MPEFLRKVLPVTMRGELPDGRVRAKMSTSDRRRLISAQDAAKFLQIHSLRSFGCCEGEKSPELPKSADNGGLTLSSWGDSWRREVRIDSFYLTPHGS